MNQFRTIGKKLVRIDGESKTTGKLKYMLDYHFGEVVYGKILYPPFFRAQIKRIDCSEALQCKDVVTIVTAEDIPGQKVHGLIHKDHPVLCESQVNYKGDAVAVIIARTEEAALMARDLIKVDYDELPCIQTMEDAVKPDAPLIHQGGNIAAHYEYKNNDDIESIFEKAPYVFEETFQTGYQEHACLETEGGIAVPGKDGVIDIWYGCQNGHRARRDLAEILNLPLEKIDVHSNPLGGGFGGKDDLLLQGILGVCALKCNKPVYIGLTREESFRMGPKRMPTRIRIKIAVDREGNFLANKVYMIGKAGPYACYTPAILDYALQLSCGMYYFPNVDITGDVVYTNSFLASAFRGFGNNQVGFAIESMMDIISQKLKIDKIELRQKNMIRSGGKHSFGNRCGTGCHSEKLVEELKKSALLSHAGEFKSKAAKPWLKRGVGIAMIQQGVGLGNHVKPDASASVVELLENGRLRVSFGNEDMGQGCITTLLMIASEAMHMPIESMEYVNGITSKAPDSGPTTASRVTYITGKAICSCIGQLQEEIARSLGCEVQQLIYTDDGVNQRSWREIAGLISESGRKKTNTQEFEYETRDINLGLNLFFSNAAQVTGVEVNTLTGETRVLESEIIPSCGTVINRLGYEGQCEGGVVMSQGYALCEEFKEGTRSFQTYLIPTMADCPDIMVRPIEEPEDTGPFGAKGLAEIVNVTGTPAIVNAIYDAVNIRFVEIPVSPQKMLLALKNQ
jgi:CO/xanthine dehydrogenase Mo-binding subunit